MTDHRCSHCAREFNRHEHLVRHERTHTKEKPYHCSLCPQAFARRDLLRRHEIKAHNYRVRRISTANGISPTERRPRLPSLPSIPLHQDTEPPLPAADYTVNTSNVDTLWPERQGPPPPLDLPPPDMGVPTCIPVQDYMLPDTMQWLESLDSSGDAFGGNFNLLGAFDSPESNQPAVPYPLDPSLGAQQRSILSHPGSPLLHSTPASASSHASSRKSHLEMTEECWESLRLEVAQHDPTLSLPKRQSMSAFIRRYFRSFQRHQPILHEPTWSPAGSLPSLTLAVCANGAIYSLERAAAVEMHRLAVELLTPDDGRLQSLQAMMLLGAFSAWDDPLTTFRTTLKLHGYLTIAVRKTWASADLRRNRDEVSWEKWIAEESLKRSAHCVFTLLTLITIAFNIPSPFMLADRHGLPVHERQWNSSTETQWLQNRNAVPKQEWESIKAVVDRLGDTSLPVPTNLGMFGCHVVISYLVQKIMLFRKFCFQDAPGYSDTRNHLLRLLKRWQIMWENEPESTLSPENPHGPILFNCTAILRVAYIRLVSDYSSVREDFSVCSEYQVAKTLEAMEVPLREPEATRAVLQAILALRIPAQLGFKVVARTSFWVWSVQHALSYFECAVFLSKWCQAVAKADDLSDDERSVLNLVEQVIGASGEENGHGESPLPLHAVVLHRWAELLDTGGTTVWNIMPRMANALRAYVSSLSGR